MPNHRTIKSSTLGTILTQSGISKEEFLKAYTEANSSKPIVAENIPPAEEIMAVGIGKFLN